MRMEKLAAFARELGIVSFFYSDGSLPKDLTEVEKKIYRAVAVRIAVNDCIINEGIAIPDAVNEIDSKPIPDVPMLIFVSDGNETGVENWVDIQKEYAVGLTNAEVIQLDCGHYVHNFEQEQIAERVRNFIASLE